MVRGAQLVNGGEHGIRTHDTLARIRPFQGRAFDHSANSPFKLKLFIIGEKDVLEFIVERALLFKEIG